MQKCKLIAKMPARLTGFGRKNSDFLQKFHTNVVFLQEKTFFKYESYRTNIKSDLFYYN